MSYHEPSSNVDDLAQRVIEAAIEVHRVLGAGFLETVYEEALCLELGLRGIEFSQQHGISVTYKGHPIGEGRLDLLVGKILVVELKAVDVLLPIHTAQVLSFSRQRDCRLVC